MFVSYLWSVTAASGTFNLLFVGHALLVNGFESATNNDLITKASHLTAMLLMSFIAGWIFAFTTAFAPFLFGMSIANYKKFSHWSYFVVGASLTALAICPLFNSIPNLGINVQYPEPTALEVFWRAAPYFLSSGAVAGLACWLTIRKRNDA